MDSIQELLEYLKKVANPKLRKYAEAVEQLQEALITEKRVRKDYQNNYRSLLDKCEAYERILDRDIHIHFHHGEQGDGFTKRMFDQDEAKKPNLTTLEQSTYEKLNKRQDLMNYMENAKIDSYRAKGHSEDGGEK
jgi:Na+/phosphate symporter